MQRSDNQSHTDNTNIWGSSSPFQFDHNVQQITDQAGTLNDNAARVDSLANLIMTHTRGRKSLYDLDAMSLYLNEADSDDWSSHGSFLPHQENFLLLPISSQKEWTDWLFNQAPFNSVGNTQEIESSLQRILKHVDSFGASQHELFSHGQLIFFLLLKKAVVNEAETNLVIKASQIDQCRGILQSLGYHNEQIRILENILYSGLSCLDQVMSLYEPEIYHKILRVARFSGNVEVERIFILVMMLLHFQGVNEQEDVIKNKFNDISEKVKVTAKELMIEEIFSNDDIKNLIVSFGYGSHPLNHSFDLSMLQKAMTSELIDFEVANKVRQSQILQLLFCVFLQLQEQSTDSDHNINHEILIFLKHYLEDWKAVPLLRLIVKFYSPQLTKIELLQILKYAEDMSIEGFIKLSNEAAFSSNGLYVINFFHRVTKLWDSYYYFPSISFNDIELVYKLYHLLKEEERTEANLVQIVLSMINPVTPVCARNFISDLDGKEKALTFADLTILRKMLPFWNSKLASRDILNENTFSFVLELLAKTQQEVAAEGKIFFISLFILSHFNSSHLVQKKFKNTIDQFLRFPSNLSEPGAETLASSLMIFAEHLNRECNKYRPFFNYLVNETDKLSDNDRLIAFDKFTRSFKMVGCSLNRLNKVMTNVEIFEKNSFHPFFVFGDDSGHIINEYRWNEFKSIFQGFSDEQAAILISAIKGFTPEQNEILSSFQTLPILNNFSVAKRAAYILMIQGAHGFNVPACLNIVENNAWPVDTILYLWSNLGGRMQAFLQAIEPLPQNIIAKFLNTLCLGYKNDNLKTLFSLRQNLDATTISHFLNYLEVSQEICCHSILIAQHLSTYIKAEDWTPKLHAEATNAVHSLKLDLKNSWPPFFAIRALLPSEALTLPNTKKLGDFLSQFRLPSEAPFVRFLIERLKLVPKRERWTFIDEMLQPIFTQYPNAPKRHFVQILPFISNEDRKDVIPQIFGWAQQGLTPLEALHIILTDEGVKTRSYDYWFKTVNQLDVCSDSVQQANMLIRISGELFLAIEDPIIKVAMEFIVANDPEYKTNWRHNVRVYDDLKKYRAELTYRPSLEDSSLKRRKFGERYIVYDLDTFRSAAAMFQLKFADLPRAPHINLMNELFHQFYDRYKALDPQAQQLVDLEIKLAYPFVSFTADDTIPCLKKVEKTQENINKHGAVYSLLKEKGSPQDPVDKHVYAIYHILNWIEAGNPTPSKRGDLTERERRLFGLALNLQMCTSGQKNGILKYFSLIEKDLNLAVKSDTNDNPLFAYVDGKIKKEIENTFEKKEFLETLQASEHPIHQKDYLLGKFGEMFGINEAVKFDHQAITISPNLQYINNWAIIEHISNHCNCDHVIDVLKRAITEDLLQTREVEKQESSLKGEDLRKLKDKFKNIPVKYANLTDAIEKGLPESRKKTIWKDYLIFDDDFNAIGIKEIGVIYMLLGLKFFKEVKASKRKAKEAQLDNLDT